MWTCLECAGWPCIPFFLFTFVIGNLVVRTLTNLLLILLRLRVDFTFQVLNLFLALLLASFGSNMLAEREKDDDDNKIGEAIDRIQRCLRFLVRTFIQFLCRLLPKRQQIPESVTKETIYLNQVCRENMSC